MKYSFLFSALVSLAFFSCKYTSTFPIDEPKKECMNDAIVGKWKLVEDTNGNNFYEIYKSKFNPYSYHIRFWNRGGRNPTYEADAFFSCLESSSFLNVPYWEYDLDKNRGYFFLKILSISKDSAAVTMVADDNLRVLPGKEAVRQRITANMSRPEYYIYNFHFYKGDFQRVK
jgi:hypothetical protein